jgi:hypothetical protein
LLPSPKENLTKRRRPPAAKGCSIVAHVHDVLVAGALFRNGVAGRSANTLEP